MRYEQYHRTSIIDEINVAYAKGDLPQYLQHLLIHMEYHIGRSPDNFLEIVTDLKLNPNNIPNKNEREELAQQIEQILISKYSQ